MTTGSNILVSVLAKTLALLVRGILVLARQGWTAGRWVASWIDAQWVVRR